SPPPPLAPVQKFHRRFELPVEPFDQPRNRFRLDPKHPFRSRQRRLRVIARLRRLYRASRATHHASHFLTSPPSATIFSISPRNCPSASAFDPSESAFAGLSCTSRKIPSTPAATPARASGSINSGCPPLDFPSPPGSCTECVTSNTTGQPVLRMIGNARMSTTRF